MPLQNRVTPSGDIVCDPSRGLMMGNRGGALHDADRKLRSRRWVSRQWICCRLDFNGRRRTVMAPGLYTELFFLDEATALAAGHRPCFECRRWDATRFAAAWARAQGSEKAPRAAEMDRTLHAERLNQDGSKRLHAAALEALPDGSMVLVPGRDGPHLRLGARLLRWTARGYSKSQDMPGNWEVLALTPPSIIGALECGYRPLLHASADGTG